MRGIFSIALIAAVGFAGVQWYATSAAICPVPLSYRLGAYDDRFSLPPEEVKEVIAEAETAWETALGRELFVYDEAAEFPIDFVFDERQQQALTQEKLRAALDQKELASNKTLQALEKLNSEYEVLKAKYEQQLRTYNGRLDRYNQRVAETNEAGGATPEEFEELNREQKALELEGRKIDTASKSLNELVNNINELGEEGNALIDEYNQNVGTYNQQFGEGGAFTQGEFTSDRITVYKYTDKNELLKVLTHEFGHALGIGHVEDSKAIMYYLLEQQPAELTLASADKEAAQAVCGTGNELSQRLRRLIRTAVAFIT